MAGNGPNPNAQRRVGSTNDINFDELSELSRELRRNPLLRGRLFDNIEVGGKSQIRISHGLGRNYTGFIVLNTTLGVTENAGAATRKSQELVLDIDTALSSKSTFNLKLWVF